jgi:hypothetical protein
MTPSIHDALSTLLGELLDGSAKDSGWVLNPSDPGLIKSLAAISHDDASVIPAGGRSSIASHVDHLRYGLSLMSRMSHGESPFKDADWTASWMRAAVSKSEWETLVRDFEKEARAWQAVVRQPRPLTDDELKGYVASAVHLAYHVGAIRQMSAGARGPSGMAKD